MEINEEGFEETTGHFAEHGRRAQSTGYVPPLCLLPGRGGTAWMRNVIKRTGKRSARTWIEDMGSVGRAIIDKINTSGIVGLGPFLEEISLNPRSSYYNKFCQVAEVSNALFARVDPEKQVTKSEIFAAAAEEMRRRKQIDNHLHAVQNDADRDLHDVQNCEPMAEEHELISAGSANLDLRHVSVEKRLRALQAWLKDSDTVPIEFEGLLDALEQCLPDIYLAYAQKRIVKDRGR